ncbi:MAG TPA: universal stress protein [Glaciihabitans sp.]|nr:universal stress protein [Glaciihabitans sp.]
MYEQTVVGWDGSPHADAALEWALERALRTDKRLRLIRVVDNTALYVNELETKRSIVHATFLLAARAAEVRLANPSLDLLTDVIRGDPGDVLNSYSSQKVLVVVGAQARDADGFWYGSRLGSRLAALTTGAVAVIPVRDSRPRSGVVVGVGDSPADTAVVLFAAEFAHATGEELHLVRSREDASPRSGRSGADEVVMDIALAAVTAAYPELRTHCHLDGEPSNIALLHRAQNATLVTVGTHHPGVLRRMFLGSVSHALVNNIRCATIVIAPDSTGDIRM